MRRPIPKSLTIDGGARWVTTPWIIQDGAGNPVAPAKACGDYVERRTATCVNGAGDRVDEMYCRGQEKPDLERQARHDGGCTYSWSTGDWQDPGASCSLAETQTREVTCRRDTDRAVMADSFCAGEKPTSTQTVQDFSTCTYRWVPGAFVDPGAACTDSERQTRPVDCVRDLDQAKVGDALCTTTKPSTTQDVRDISGCTYSWKTGPFVDPGPSCTRSETQMRTVSCHRSLNDELAPDTSCAAGDRPNWTQTVEDYASCSFKAVDWTAWTPSSNCSATAIKTRTAKCQRSNDGSEIVDDALCTAAGVALSETVPEANYSSCSHSWSYSPYADPGASCTTSETQFRTSWCKRDLDQQTVADALCSTGSREALSRTVQDFSGCDYAAANWGPYSFSSTCSATAVKTRTAQCRRSDGTIVAATECTTRNKSLTESVTEPNYSTCTNSWVPSGFVDPGANCGNETWTQTVTCRRDLDKAVMSDAACSGTKPATTDVRYDVSSCGYAAANWTSWKPSSTCSATATKTRTAQCRRSDGQIVGASECTSRGIALSETVPEANYSTCSSSWRESGFVDPGASCGSETWSQTVTCKRDLDNATMPDASCPGTKPASTSIRTDYSGCGYTAVNWTGWTYASACSARTSRTQTAQCRRSDGTIVDGSVCVANGVPVSRTETGVSNYASCSYSPSSTQSSCTNGSQTVNWTCTRVQTGQQVAQSFCSLPAQSTQSCSSYSWQTGGWTGFGACQAPGVQYQSRDVYCQQNNGGTLSRVDEGFCGGGKPAASNSQACTYYTYDWFQGGFGGWSSTCGAATRSQTVYCRRAPDGAQVADANCAGAAKPAATDSAYQISGCGYTPSYSGLSACSNGSQSQSMTACTRSDGQPVSLSECTSRGHAATTSQTCSCVVSPQVQLFIGSGNGYVYHTNGYSSGSSSVAQLTYTCTRFQGHYSVMDNGVLRTMTAGAECTPGYPCNSRSSMTVGGVVYQMNFSVGVTGGYGGGGSSGGSGGPSYCSYSVSVTPSAASNLPMCQ